jgi:hypothetical protein
MMRGEMISTRTFAALLIFLACAGATASSAALQDYCGAFAGHAASNKTGLGTDGGEESDVRWREAYDKAFGTCMDHYKPQPRRASVAKKASGTKLLRKSPSRKAAAQTVKSRKRKSATKRSTPATKQSTPAPNRSRRSPSVERKATAGAAAGQRGTLCRRLSVGKKGSYEIINCKPGVR